MINLSNYFDENGIKNFDKDGKQLSKRSKILWLIQDFTKRKRGGPSYSQCYKILFDTFFAKYKVNNYNYENYTSTQNIDLISEIKLFDEFYDLAILLFAVNKSKLFIPKIQLRKKLH